ncbi:MAG: serine--tRNA ligase [Devosia sp.]|nr:serine--tRNA ligase [Devosia sp.]
MLDINWIKANPDAFDAMRTHRKNVPFKASDLIAMDESRRAVILSVEDAQAKRNALSKQIGQAKAQKDEAKAAELMAEVAHLKDVVQSGEAARKEAEERLRQALLVLPNLPLDEVPRGADEADNQEYYGPNGSPATAAGARPKKPVFAFKPKEHFETGEAMGQMDFEVAAKISGSRFVVLKSHLARLERAIGQFMLDLHVDEHGYTEVNPPLLVKDDALYGTNQLPKFEEDLFRTARTLSPLEQKWKKIEASWGAIRDGILKHSDSTLDEAEIGATATIADLKRRIEATDLSVGSLSEVDASAFLYLIPTAEVPLTNLVRESILAEDELPLRFTALTPCFRSEAGSAGRDTRGMLRQHQFNKVEMVSITTPERSIEEHEKMVADAEDVLKRLGIHYRVMTLSTGDMGFGAQKTYDIEAWLPGQDAYREISSVSVCGDFQARRMDARYRDNQGKVRHVHTLNGSGVAVGRALIAVMENYQQEDGSVAIPEVLQPYMKGLKSIGGKS